MADRKDEMKNTAVVVAGGSGTRMSEVGQEKVFIRINGKPVLAYTLENFQKSPVIDDIVLVIREDMLPEAEELIVKYAIDKVSSIVPGGERRQDSVLNGLMAVSDDTSAVYIHDGVRPFLSQELLSRLSDASCEHKAVICGIPLDCTIKKVNDNGEVDKTVDRSDIWKVQTPQVFSKELLMDAFEQTGSTVTDEAIMLEALGFPVFMVNGEPFNIKITYPYDIEMAQLIAEKRARVSQE